MPQLDMKSLLLLSGSPVFHALKATPKAWVIPSIAIYPTTRCNYKCAMCWLTTADEKLLESMSPELMDKVLSQAAALLVKPKIHFSGYGEPLVYPHIREAMRMCHEKGLSWSLTTNGYLLEKFADDLLTYGCSGVNLSVHGDEELHNRNVGVKNAYQRTIDGLHKLDEAKRRAGQTSPLVAVNCVINADNVAMLPGVLETFQKFPINSITFQHLAFMECDVEKHEQFLITSRPQIDALLAFKHQTESASLPMRVNFFPRMDDEMFYKYYLNTDYRPQTACVMPWLTMRIFPSGEVQMCGNVYGNVKENTLRELMNSPKALEFRDDIRHKQYGSEVCYRCCHQNYAQEKV